MLKQDYVANVSPPEKWLAIVALLAGTLVSGACCLLVVGIAIVGIDDLPARAIYGSIAIFGPLTLMSGWMLIRLLRRQHAANGRTVMPEWFIQVFGILFLLGICTIAIADGRPWWFGQALGVALAMIGVRSLLRQPVSH